MRKGLLPGIEGKKVFRPQGGRGRNVKDVCCARAKRFRVPGAEGFSRMKNFRPCNGGFHKRAGLDIIFNGRQHGPALIRGDGLPKQGEPERVAEFVPVQGREDKRGFESAAYLPGLFTVRVLPVEGEKKAGVRVNYHLLCSRSSRMTFGRVFFPKIAFARAAKSGILH